MILLYVADRHQALEQVERLVAEYAFGRPVIHCRSLSALEMRLRRPHHLIELVLICVGDSMEMVRLTEMRPLLLDSRLVMVLPSHDVDMVAWAHKLGPRFIGYADSGCQAAGAVLDKMLNPGDGGCRVIPLKPM